MAAKINLIKKSTDYGNQLVTVDTSELETLGFLREGESDVKLMELISEKVADGYYIFEYKGTSGSVYSISKKTDGLCRDLEGVEWHKNLKLFNAENDPLKWCQNVDAWFQGALEDEDYVKSLNSLCEQALMTAPKNGDDPFELDNQFEEAKQWLKEQQPSKKGATGKRPIDINGYLTKSNTGYLPRNAKAFIKWNGSKGGWKKKVFWK